MPDREYTPHHNMDEMEALAARDRARHHRYRKMLKAFFAKLKKEAR